MLKIFKGWCLYLAFIFLRVIATSVIKYSVFLQLRSAETYCKMHVCDQNDPV